MQVHPYPRPHCHMADRSALPPPSQGRRGFWEGQKLTWPRAFLLDGPALPAGEGDGCHLLTDLKPHFTQHLHQLCYRGPLRPQHTNMGRACPAACLSLRVHCGAHRSTGQCGEECAPNSHQHLRLASGNERQRTAFTSINHKRIYIHWFYY